MNPTHDHATVTPEAGNPPGPGRTTSPSVRRAPIVGLLVAAVLLAGCGSDPLSVSSPLGEPTAAPTSEPADAHTSAPDTPADPSETETTTPGETDTTAAPAACPTRTGATVECAVEFHEWPDDVTVGEDLHCGQVARVWPDMELVIVQVWDEDDFLSRTDADPNVRRVEPNGVQRVEPYGPPRSLPDEKPTPVEPPSES